MEAADGGAEFHGRLLDGVLFAVSWGPVGFSQGLLDGFEALVEFGGFPGAAAAIEDSGEGLGFERREFTGGDGADQGVV